MFRLATVLSFLAATVTASSVKRDSGPTGDSVCANSLCISAAVNGPNVDYILTYSDSKPVGWVAMGFGTSMTNAQMVIMWPNSDGSVTLSQRTASSHVMPTVDATPVRTANYSTALSNVAASKPQFAFSVPVNNDTTQSIVYAYSYSAPSGSAVDATIMVHANAGPLSLDLTKPLSASSNATTSGSASTPSASKTSGAQSSYTKMLVAPAILAASIAFLV